MLAAVVAQDEAEGVGGGKIPAFTAGYSDGESICFVSGLDCLLVNI